MKIHHFLLFGICFLVLSCQSVVKIVAKKDIPNLSENKLMKYIAGNELAYHSMFVKRMDIALKNEKGSNNFRATLKIQKNNFIQISINAPLGIEVARILLMPDSIKFVDIYHKRYFFADYSYFYDKYDVNLSYDCIQNILTNTFFNFEMCGGGTGKIKKYKLDRTEVGYELFTVEERALSRKIKKLYKKKRKNKEFMLVLQKILIDPQNFRPLSLSLEDIEEEMGLGINYTDFKEISGKVFPGKIIFNLYSEQKLMSVELKFQKIEFDVPVESNLRISSKYKRIQ